MGGRGGKGTSGLFSRGHMLSWLHTVDTDSLAVDVGGMGGGARILGRE
jgi:hypothetical protein